MYLNLYDIILFLYLCKNAKLETFSLKGDIFL